MGVYDRDWAREDARHRERLPHVESDVERWARVSANKQDPRAVAPAHTARPTRRSRPAAIPVAFVGLCVVVILALAVAVALASGAVTITYVPGH